MLLSMISDAAAPWHDKRRRVCLAAARWIACHSFFICALLLAGCVQVERDSSPEMAARENCTDIRDRKCKPPHDSQSDSQDTWAPATLLGKSKDDVVACLGEVGGITEVSSDDVDTEERVLYWFDDLAVAFDKRGVAVAIFNFTEKWVLRQWLGK